MAGMCGVEARHGGRVCIALEVVESSLVAASFQTRVADHRPDQSQHVPYGVAILPCTVCVCSRNHDTLRPRRLGSVPHPWAGSMTMIRTPCWNWSGVFTERFHPLTSAPPNFLPCHRR